MSKAGEMAMTARFIMHWITDSQTLERAREIAPELTAEQWAALKEGRATLTGDTREGIEYVEHA